MFSVNVRTASETYPAYYPLGTGGSFTVGKRPGEGQA